MADAGDVIMKSQHAVQVHPRSIRGFRRIYGWTGIPMLVLCSFAVAWTIMLAAIQHDPTYVANYVMGTRDFDSGEFWLLPKPDEAVAVPAAIILVILAASYLGVVLLMIFPDKLLRRPQPSHRYLMGNAAPQVAPAPPDGILRWLRTGLESRKQSRVAWGNRQPLKRRLRRRLRRWARSVFGTSHHYFDSPVLVLPKLIFQTVALVSYLRVGLPPTIVFNYSILLFVNWLIACYRFQHVKADLHRVTTRVFLGFDLFFAVFAPLQVLVYAYFNFSSDRGEFMTRVETFSADSFERTARLFADPTEMSLFHIAFQSLQLTSATSLLMKCALNVLTIWKWRRVIVRLVEIAAESEDAQEEEEEEGEGEAAVTAPSNKRTPPRHRGRLALLTGLVFCTGLSIFVYSIAAVVSSTLVCRAHSHCKVHSYRLNSSSGPCPCIVFVDRNTHVKTFAEWENPPDTTANLAALAATGHLQTIQIINRQLPTFPDELRKCTDLKQIILMYAKITSIPDWAKEFVNLEYLHIEAGSTTKQLTYMPRDLFSSMKQLKFIHFGGLEGVPYVPDLAHLDKLEYLVLVALYSITELPSFNHLVSLKKLNIMDNHRLASLPELHELPKLSWIAVRFRHRLCCNGFLTNKCDLTSAWCRAADGEPPVSCSPKTISAEDRTILFSTQGQVCSDPAIVMDFSAFGPSRALVDDACGGVEYKQCKVFGLDGMCYPDRMQPIMCTIQPTFVAMRRLQIARGVGEPCDPSVEQWLGCV